MTAIAWDGKTLAADKQTSWGDLKYRTTKIRKQPDGTLVAVAGQVTIAAQMADYLLHRDDPGGRTWPEKSDDYGWVIFVSPEGVVTWYTSERPYPHHVEQQFMAWGSAREIAMGALAAGASAERALEICIELSPGCGFGVQVETPGIENPG